MGISVSFKIKSGFNSNKLLSAYKNNMRKYTNTDDVENIFSENIKYNVLLEGEENIYESVRNIYKAEFLEAIINYNSKQKRADRRIYDYFEKISESKTSLYTEIIVQIGDKDFRYDKSIEEKLKMVDVFREQIKIIKEFFPNFKIANAVVHLDMISPKTHIIGVPVSNKELALQINERKKNQKKQIGLDTYVCQSEVFTRNGLREFHQIFDKKSIEIFNEIYQANEILNDKKLHQKHLELEEYKHIAPMIKKLQKEYDLLKLQKLELLKEIELLKKKKKSIQRSDYGSSRK